MENHTVLKPVELASYTHEILNSLRLPPLELPKGNKPGKMRGVEFYGRHLPDVLMECLTRYHRVHDRFPPPPLECQSINDKIFWSKFIVPMSVPTAADKLSVGKYIPKNLRSKIRPPKVYWISDRPNFPSTIKGPDGLYMLKANHSWGTFRKIKFPIEQSERAELEELGRSWLARKNYNLKGGEWWYSTITPKLYIEELVSDDDNSPREFHFRCVKGEVVGISMTQRDGVGKDNFETAYHADFSWNSEIKFFKSLPNNYNETPKNSKNMIEYASAIAQQFEYARVDFYSPQPDVVLLGELTLCSGAGLSYILPNSEDLSMGASWDMSQYFI